MFVELSNIAQSNGMTLNAIEMTPLETQETPTEEVDEALQLISQNVKKLQISFETSIAKEDYGSLKEFLRKLESNVRLLDVVSYEYTPKATTIDFEVIAYYLGS